MEYRGGGVSKDVCGRGGGGILDFTPILYQAKDPLQILIVVIISLPTNYHLI